MQKFNYFIKTIFHNFLEQSSHNIFFIVILFFIVTNTLPHVYNNIALVILVIYLFVKHKSLKFKFNVDLFLPLLFFLLMLLSVLNSIDSEETLNSLPKEISLLLLPLVFMLIPLFKQNQKNAVIKYYSYSMVIFSIYYLLRATFRYLLYHDTRVFFYHGENNIDYGLVPKLLNAIHVSVYISLAFFYFLSKEIKTKFDIIIFVFLFGFMMLLSSKNSILILILLIIVYFFYYSKIAHKMRLRNLVVFGLIIVCLFFFGKIKETLNEEYQSNTSKSLSPNVINKIPNKVHNVSIEEAWNNKNFSEDDYFPGTAFRVYQFRMFLEILNHENVFFTGLGFNASQIKLTELGNKHGVYSGENGKYGYGNFNFHNQYIQNFAELGVFGILLLLLILYVNIKNAIKNKDFIHFVFAVLMISLFLTESFLWRQRGVVFFTLWYCIFNSKTFQITEKQ